MNHLEFGLHLAVAAGCGIAIGLERQWRQRMAGLRTNALVAAGACLFTTLGAFLSNDPSGAARVAAQIISGIGFLGGGVILREGLNVRGLNTAATLWCTAAVGTLAGSGLIVEAIVGSLAVLAANVFLRPIAQRINRQPTDRHTETETRYRLTLTCRKRQEASVRLSLVQALAEGPLTLRGLKHSASPDAGLVVLSATVRGFGASHEELERVVNRLCVQGTVLEVNWSLLGDESTASPENEEVSGALLPPLPEPAL